MNGRPSLFFLSLSFLLLAYPSAAGAQVSDGTVKITRRTVSAGIGFEWGQGVLTYNGRDYPFSYRAGGSFRHVDTEMTTAELSGQVFNLKTVEDFGGRYHKVEAEEPATGERLSRNDEKSKGCGGERFLSGGRTQIRSDTRGPGRGAQEVGRRRLGGFPLICVIRVKTARAR